MACNQKPLQIHRDHACNTFRIQRLAYFLDYSNECMVSTIFLSIGAEQIICCSVDEKHNLFSNKRSNTLDIAECTLIGLWLTYEVVSEPL